MRKIEVEVYTIDELSEKARQCALFQYRDMGIWNTYDKELDELLNKLDKFMQVHSNDTQDLYLQCRNILEKLALSQVWRNWQLDGFIQKARVNNWKFTKYGKLI